MYKAVNDATPQQAGTIYQYILALKDCFELEDGDILQIEVNGDISVIRSEGGKSFQKEVKHHFSDTSLNTRSEEVWKTLANWYSEYDRIKEFSCLILNTTAVPTTKSIFYNWSMLSPEQKLSVIKKIAYEEKEENIGFCKQCARIFNEKYNEIILLDILSKFTIVSGYTNLSGVSKEFDKYIMYIPKENRDKYIGALLGRILIKVKDPPHKWEISKEEFEEMIQEEAPKYMKVTFVPFPDLYKNIELTEEQKRLYWDRNFVIKILAIGLEKKVSSAIDDYWKMGSTLASLFSNDANNMMDIDDYRKFLEDKLEQTKERRLYDIEGLSEDEKIKESKKFYSDVMLWNVKDFGHIYNNQVFFQRGTIQDIADTTEFEWKLGE